MGRLALIVVSAWLALFGAQPEPSPAPSDVTETPLPAVSVAPLPMATPNAYLILAKARDVFHAHARPKYIVYTLDRREWIDDIPRGDLSYTLRIWCRATDPTAALSRLWYAARHRAVGDLHFIRPAFNQPLDPGPPTADIFEPPPPRPSPTPLPLDTIKTIGTVQTLTDLDYRALLAGAPKGQFHLKLQPVRDPERNRLRELWVDSATFEVQRALAMDRLFSIQTGTSVPDRMDMTFEMADGLPLIRRITMIANVIPTLSNSARKDESDYSFDDISYPESLPDWYFEPKTYYQHFKTESPSR